MLAVGAGWIVVAVGGMGFRLEVSERIAGAHVGARVDLHTQLVVREDSLTLFGFETVEELEVFGLLMSVSGVGPRSALGVLSTLTPGEIAQAVVGEDEKPFRKVSGIGPKTAKLIVVQLAGKLQHLVLFGGGAIEASSSVHAAPGMSRVAANVEQGLLGLGYSEIQASAAVQDAIAAGGPEEEAGLLRAALLLLQSPRLGARAATTSERGR